MNIKFVGTGEQKADILTKVLGRVRSQKLHDKIGIVVVQPRRQG